MVANSIVENWDWFCENLLSDPLWRLYNLYSIEPRRGPICLFVPNHSQRWYLKVKWWWTLLTKSRQHGFSTLEAILCCDRCLFENNYKVGLIDFRIEDAKEKLAKVLLAYEDIGKRIPGISEEDGLVINAMLKERLPKLVSKSERRLKWDNGSRFQISTGYRGGTLQRLWVSEFGNIAIHSPKTAAKILAGALPAAEHEGNVVTFESTHEGGKYGGHYKLITDAVTRIETPDSERSQTQFKFLFIPFWKNPENKRKGLWQFTDEEKGIFDGWEDDCVFLSTEQKAFWAEKYRIIGFAAFREYPAVVTDLYRAPIDGAIYGEILAKLELSGRVGSFGVERKWPSVVCWDLGGANTALWHIQTTPTEVRWLNYHQARYQHIGEIVSLLEHWDSIAPIAKHIFPHDGASHEKNGQTFKRTALDAGIRNIVVLKQPRDGKHIWLHINELRSILAASRFHSNTRKIIEIGDEKVCGFDYLGQYQMEQKPEGSTRAEMPRKDHTAHCADAGRYYAQAKIEGHINDRLAPERHTERRQFESLHW